MPKKIFPSYNNLAKQLNLKPQVLTGGLILISILVITLLSLQNLSNDTEQRSQALDKTSCGWCGNSCVLKDESTNCPATNPPDECSCVANSIGGCVTIGDGCPNTTPTVTSNPDPTITILPTSIITDTPTPSAIPTDVLCPSGDIASSLSPNGYAEGADHDCCVDAYDLTFLRLSFVNQDLKADINQDHKVNLWDYANLVSMWHQGCN